MSIEESNEQRIKEVEDQFRSPIALSSQGRSLVGEGVVQKVCRKNRQTRQIFLFNDCLILAKIDANTSKKFYSPFHVSLGDVEISNIADSPEHEHSWIIHTPKKSFQVCAIDEDEKRQWMKYIDKYTTEFKSRYNSTGPIQVAPTWVPDSAVELCMVCNTTKFSIFQRKHHCRKCGCVVCSSCSTNKLTLKNISPNPLRVCDDCYKNDQSSKKSTNMYDIIID